MIKDAKSKASRTTNEAVRETFSIKRCQSSIIFKEGESAQRVLALVAVVAAGIVCVLTAGIAAGSSAIGKFLYIRPIDIHIHHRTGSNLLAAATFHFGNKRTRMPLICAEFTSSGVVTPFLFVAAV